MTGARALWLSAALWLLAGGLALTLMPVALLLGAAALAGLLWMARAGQKAHKFDDRADEKPAIPASQRARLPEFQPAHSPRALRSRRAETHRLTFAPAPYAALDDRRR